MRVASSPGNIGEAERLHRQALAIDEELVALAPDNPDYRRGLSVSYERLADLARAAGNTGEAERLHRQALAIGEELVALAPDNPDYRHGLSVSYSKLADLARAAGNTGKADGWIDKALEVRRSVNEIEPARLDFAEEFAVVLYLSALINAERERAAKAETENLLIPFEVTGRLTLRAADLLEWARRG